MPKVLNILAEYCQTEPAKQKSRVLVSLNTKEVIEGELTRVEEISRCGQNAQFYVPFDPDYLKTKLNTVPYLLIEHLVLLKDFFNCIKKLKKSFEKTNIRIYFNRLHNYQDIIKRVDSIIDQSNQIKDDASKSLYHIRQQKKLVNKRIRQALNAMLSNRSHMFTSANIVERHGRYVVPVKSNFKNDIKGIVHSYSNSGETVFIEPLEITDESARLIELANQETNEIEDILKDVTNSIRARIDDIENDIACIVDLDLLFAKVEYANILNATRPVFGNCLNLVNSYHPILKKINDNVVPLTLHMDSKKRILLISGPNAGGKTVVLKTVGLMVLMAKCGLFIPAEEGSTMPFFEEVYADIGDEQSIEFHLSTYAAHIEQIKKALEGNKNSLILLDELMSQTSVEEGSALAAAIMEEFAQRKTTVLATTHNEDLKLFVSKRDDMINAGMEFTDRPTYRLIMGIPQASNAIKLARQMGINGGIIETAVAHLNEEKMSLNALFEDLSKELKTVQEERAELEALIKEYELKINEFRTKSKKEIEQLKTKYKNELIRTKRSVAKLIKTLKREGPRPDLVHKTRRFFDEQIAIDEPHKPYFPRIGEIVRIRDLKKNGQALAEHQGKFKISLENMYFWIDPKDIEKAGNGDHD